MFSFSSPPPSLSLLGEEELKKKKIAFWVVAVVLNIVEAEFFFFFLCACIESLPHVDEYISVDGLGLPFFLQQYTSIKKLGHCNLKRDIWLSPSNNYSLTQSILRIYFITLGGFINSIKISSHIWSSCPTLTFWRIHHLEREGGGKIQDDIRFLLFKVFWYICSWILYKFI